MIKDILFIVLLFLTACSSSGSNLINLDTAKKQVQHYYESGDYDIECETAIREGMEEIEKVQLTKKSVVVFDVDDTVLLNFGQAKSFGFGYVHTAWQDWVNNAKAPAIKKVKLFYDWLLKKNVGIIFLTGRGNEFHSATRKNLIDEGYASFDTLVTNPKQEEH